MYFDLLNLKTGWGLALLALYHINGIWLFNGSDKNLTGLDVLIPGMLSNSINSLNVVDLNATLFGIILVMLIITFPLTVKNLSSLPFYLLVV